MKEMNQINFNYMINNSTSEYNSAIPQNIFDFQVCMMWFLILHLHMLQLNTFLKLFSDFLSLFSFC